jgi:C4-dicarboxylate-specific signal transduction histidine kinase
MSTDTSTDELIALNRLVTIARVVPGTAHEVNNALQIIGGSAELLETPQGQSDSARRALARIRGQSARAAALMDDLTRFARPGEEPLVRVRFKDVIARAGALRGVMIRRAGMSIAFDADAAPDLEIKARPGQLLQAVLNMIMDAEDALERRKGGTIAVALTEESGQAVLRVRDNGSAATAVRGFGIAPDLIRFGEHTRLGLDAARLIARNHGGDVTLEALPEGGEVTLRWPL